MLRANRILPAHGLVLLAGLLAGCFTEVGNAEDDRLVEAKFQIDYKSIAPLPKAAIGGPVVNEASIVQFYLGVREAEFHLFDSLTNRKQEFHLWKDDSAILDVDFTGTDTLARLPNQKVGVLNPLEMHLQCQFPAHFALNVDTVDFDRFRDRSYIKGVLSVGKAATPFLFALPNAGGFQLLYEKQTLDGWYAAGTYRCRFIFYANRWVAGMDFSHAVLSKDATGDKVLVLDPEHNGDLHDSLEARFYHAFNTSKASYSLDP